MRPKVDSLRRSEDRVSSIRKETEKSKALLEKMSSLENRRKQVLKSIEKDVQDNETAAQLQNILKQEVNPFNKEPTSGEVALEGQVDKNTFVKEQDCKSFVSKLKKEKRERQRRLEEIQKKADEKL